MASCSTPGKVSVEAIIRRSLSRSLADISRINQALNELTQEHRAVILLREVEGLSYDEISDVLQVPRGTVMSRLHYARGHLRKILKDLGGS